jgi:hypothetical protein
MNCRGTSISKTLWDIIAFFINIVPISVPSVSSEEKRWYVGHTHFFSKRSLSLENIKTI